ncbi:MAG: aminotransferase class I/II-fold pyridoxal phosphate-dependent enzyme [Bacteroidota bacterium]
MLLEGKPKVQLNDEAIGFVNLYAALGERAESFLPNRIFESLKSFVRLCYEEPIDPARQQLEINKYVLELKEAIPGYIDVQLMIYPTEDSKAFIYNAQRGKFQGRLNEMIDQELVDKKTKTEVKRIVGAPNFSIGTPPVTEHTLDFLYDVFLGDKVSDIRKFRDVIGVKGDIEEAQWNYFLDVLDQMVNQSTHYTTKAEKDNFLNRSESSINFKGLNGFIRTVVSGPSDTAIKLIAGEVFSKNAVKVIEWDDEQRVYDQINEDSTSVFAVKVKHMRTNYFNKFRWFPLLSRMVFIDDSIESQSTNTTLVWALHNDIVATLNKAHNKKLGALANSQANLRLILDKVNSDSLSHFAERIELKISDYEEELLKLKEDQNADPADKKQELSMFKFDSFARQIIKDKYTLSKLGSYIEFVQRVKDNKQHAKVNKELISEFENRSVKYFYGNNDSVQIATVVEGGGRSQIKTYGEYLLDRKLAPVDADLAERCEVILDVIPTNYERTLQNHFHKNFGVNLFLEKYKQYLTKIENEADNKGRFHNFLIDLGIFEKYEALGAKQQTIIKEFIAGLGNLDHTSVGDDVQMIIRDLLFNPVKPNPFIFINSEASWEYRDLFSYEHFDINPFDIEIELKPDGRVDYERLQKKLETIKVTFQLFDESGRLWDRFCENSTLVINDPSNPTGLTDFNNESLIKFLKFLNNSKITLFLDEAYNDAVKIEDEDEPKWRTISRYIMNNIGTYSKISMVSSISTTKNLGATGDRLGSLIASPACIAVTDYATKQFAPEKGNSNSLYLLNNVLEVAQRAKKIKDQLEESLPKDASRTKIKTQIEKYIFAENANCANYKENPSKVARTSMFEGSPLHIFLLEELLSLDKLDVLELPDDFKYKGEAFFSYFSKNLVKGLNNFRINKAFRNESLKRLKLAKEVAEKVLEKRGADYVSILDSDGSYLFNLVLKDFFSYQELELFSMRLAKERGIAVIPYQTGFVRWSLGDYLEGTPGSYKAFAKEFENGLDIFLKYWEVYYAKRKTPENRDKEAVDILNDIFAGKEEDFLDGVIADFDLIKAIDKKTNVSLRISDIKSLYAATPRKSGLTINSIGGSKNAMLEFYETIGEYTTLPEFLNSKAFTKLYENLLPQFYKNIPALRKMDINLVIARYGKPTLLKYIDSKVNFQPNPYILDDPDEMLIMSEILLELEKILFSDAKFKFLTLEANEKDINGDFARLEGYNIVLRKFFRELLLHFNLPFDQEAKEPVLKELFYKAAEKQEFITGKQFADLRLEDRVKELKGELRDNNDDLWSTFGNKNLTQQFDVIDEYIFGTEDKTEQLFRYYLITRGEEFSALLSDSAAHFNKQLEALEDLEVKMISESIANTLYKAELDKIVSILDRRALEKVVNDDVEVAGRKMVLFLNGMLNKSFGTSYYNRYNHYMIKLLAAEFVAQNSNKNEMVQHGITIFKDYEMENKSLETHNGGALNWINKVMTRTGVIAAEKDVQIITRSNTDAKKREFPFFKVDRVEEPVIIKDGEKQNDVEFVKNLSTLPSSEFFNDRMAKFVDNMDDDDYRCKIVQNGLVKELYVLQKSYMKYLADNLRLMGTDTISLKEAKNFVPDIILFAGAPEKVISYPHVGYFDLKGPKGNIKTVVTPLHLKGDYFGNIKKPRLTMLNEKVKEMGGYPVHGSLFAVEEEDGTVFTIKIAGDSGVGKSEMLAAMQLKWLKEDLPGIRSIKLIAGDMFHIFPDKEGNLYGIGTEVGDFARVTDFDPAYIYAYRTLFESAAESNVEDLNSRATITGFCDLSMPMKIDVMLTASNFAKEEAGIKRYANPENFLMYRDSHGERKEKATSGDNPNFARTLARYSADKVLVNILAEHGNYLDQILDWEEIKAEKKFYLASTYKMIDRIDVEEVVNTIFSDREFKHGSKEFKVDEVRFDVIKNRFRLNATEINVAEGEEATTHTQLLDRAFFNGIFNALASTPAGNPFINEDGQMEQRKQLVHIMKGGNDGSLKGKNIQCGILSTEIGKSGKEITGPQKAAKDVKELLREVRIASPEINQNKEWVKKEIIEKYGELFKHHKHSLEVWRYNFYLFQLEQMRKAEFVRLDDLTQDVKFDMLKGFEPLPKNHVFSPLLLTPAINIELNGFSETYEQLMWLPNNRDFAEELYQQCDQVYIAKGYHKETVINNMVLQLLLLNGFIAIEDLTRGKITEKANRETIAAAKFAAVKKYEEMLIIAKTPKAAPKKDKKGGKKK